MPPEVRQPPSDDAAGGPGEWIVTFSDCMTLLLCFFVLLLTFSSFDEVSLQQLGKALDLSAYQSIFPSRKKNVTALVPAIDRPVDRTEEGAERLTETEARRTTNPEKLPDIFSVDAYRDKKVFRIPSAILFWGRGGHLTPIGREMLDRIAVFMRRMPSKIVVQEVHCGAPGAAVDTALTRAWTIVEYLTGTGEVEPERFSIAAGEPGGGDGRADAAAMEITMVSWSTFR